MACWFTCRRRGHSARLVNSFCWKPLLIWAQADLVWSRSISRNLP